MKEFTYTITNKTGLHTRRAGLLAMHAKAFQDTRITVSSNGNTANTNQLMKLISMGLRQGSKVTVAAEGPQENAAIDNMQSFFEYYL
ncbi:HPr family phosphocarrier protein [Flintibacter muris]|uniref:HPr family phosphocarrier protein n=1 Tax=Flintibacter muris TaxID=2941327 RepID=UPI00203EC778|nr:HPr family phosphocarrier protein [Flintibacter muris]